MYKNASDRILEAYTGDYGKGLHVREIAKALKISPSAASYMTRRLERSGILRHVTEGRNKKYFINFGNPSAKDMLVAAEISKRTAAMERYFIIKKLAGEVNFRAAVALLFGSFAKGAAGEGSDIDILIIGKNKAFESDLEKFGKLYKKQVQVMFLRENDFVQGSEFVNEVIKSHVVLNNAEGFVDIVWRMKNER